MLRPTAILLALTLALIAVGAAPTAHALSCNVIENAAEHVAATDVIFRGKAIAARVQDGPWGRETVTTFRVLRVFKGAAGATVEVASPDLWGSLTFRTGVSRLVFANTANGRLEVSSCSVPQLGRLDYSRALRDAARNR